MHKENFVKESDHKPYIDLKGYRSLHFVIRQFSRVKQMIVNTSTIVDT